jgi:NitT/TauT family transport system permease protein
MRGQTIGYEAAGRQGADPRKAEGGAKSWSARLGGWSRDEPENEAALARWERWLYALCPYVVGVVFLTVWEVEVRVRGVPIYILPPPSAVAVELWADFATLFDSLLVTLKITLLAFFFAATGGILLAIVLTSSRLVERSLIPYAVILQVTPTVAIAPLIIIWAKNASLALFICAWLVAFFPVVSNAVTGLHSADSNLTSLFRLYRANRLQTLLLLRLPGALPYYLTGLRISSGLSLIGAVVAEFVAGTGGTQSGLAYRVLESGYRLEIPRMFAALFLISVTGIALYGLVAVFSNLCLRNWHESAVKQE